AGINGRGSMGAKKQVAVCVINLKGGVGKSTITALLARRAFSNRKLNVLAVDLDPQANLSQALLGDNYVKFLKEGYPSIVEVFNGYRPPTTTSGPTVLSADDAIQTVNKLADRSLQLIPSRFDF